jgi:hypothetical protein
MKTLGDSEFEEDMNEIHSTEEKKDVEEYSTNEEIKTDTLKFSRKKLQKKKLLKNLAFLQVFIFCFHF